MSQGQVGRMRLEGSRDTLHRQLCSRRAWLPQPPAAHLLTFTSRRPTLLLQHCSMDKTCCQP